MSNAIAEALTILVGPGSVVELRLPDTGRKGRVISGYFDDAEALADNAARLTRQYPAVYLTLNPVRPELLARRANRVVEYPEKSTGDADIDCRRWLFVDLDPERPAGIAATDDEHEAAIEQARRLRSSMVDRGWPEPVAIDSGNGAYLLWRIDLPNNDDSTALVTGCLKALGELTDLAVRVDQTAYNASRIARLPGTWNRKGDEVGDRRHRLAKLLHVPDSLEIVSAERLREMAPTIAAAAATAAPEHRIPGSFDAAAFIHEHLAVRDEGPYEGGYRWMLARCPLHNEETSGSSCAVIQWADGTLIFACRHDRCAGKQWRDLRERFEPGYRDHRDQTAALRQLAGQPDEPAPSAPRQFTPLTARQFIELPDPEGSDNLLGPLLRRKQRTIIGGHTGEGKTTLVAEMLAAFLKKREWLGFVGVGGRALVIDLEQGQRSIKRMLRTADLQGHDDLDILPVPDGLDLDKDEVQRDQIEELIRDHHYDIVVLDPYYKAHTGDSNDERQTDSLMRIFDRWRTEYGFCLVMPAHCRKPNPAMPGAFTIHDIFGSSAFLRGAEVVVGIRRLKDGYSKLYFFKDRDGELPTGSAWGLLFDSDGYRRDPADGVERDYLAELDAAMEPGTWYSFSELKAPKAKGGIGARKEAIEPVLSSHPEVFEEGDKAAAGRSWKGKYWRKLSPLSPEPGDSFSELKTLGSCHETQVPGSAKPVTVSPSYIGDRFGRDTFAEGHCPGCGAKLLPHIEHFCAAHPLAGGDR